MENCTNVVVTVRCVVITQHLEVWNCAETTLRLDAPVATVQADSCRDCVVILRAREDLGAVVHATCEGSLRVTWPEKTYEETREETRREHDENTTDPERTRDVSSRFDQIDLVADARALAPISLAPSETPQFITRLIDSVPTTERVVRDKHDYPTTAREMLLDRADQARAGDAAALNAIAADEPVELAARVRARRRDARTETRGSRRATIRKRSCTTRRVSRLTSRITWRTRIARRAS